jgi:hypothetical protein
MQKYHGVCQDERGNVIASATVTVKNHLTGSVAPIFEDDETTTKANPIITDVQGRYEFKAVAGLYDILAVFGAYSSTLTSVTLMDDPSLLYLENDSGSVLAYGDIVCINGSNTVTLARSDTTEAEASAVAVCMETIADGSTGRFRALGLIEIAGTAGDLGYLSNTPGEITFTIPTTGRSTILGVQTSADKFYFDPTLPILL